MGRFRDNIILFIAQGALSGRIPVAPGTAGTIVSVLLYFMIRGLSPAGYLIMTLVVITIGTWAAGEADRILGTKDNPSIVIDEIAGFLVAMFLVPFAWGYVAAGFLLFRLFDILKPWPLRRLQDVSGGAGVMLDDIGAAVCTNIVLQAIVHLTGRS